MSASATLSPNLEGRRAEDLVDRWLRASGFHPERFPLRRRKLGKTPDFQVRDGSGGNAFLCEVKTLTRTAPGHGAIAFKLVRARAQFDAVNQGGRLANIVVLVTPFPDALATPVVDLGALPTSPLARLDLVLGLAPVDARARVLHRAPASRHVELLARLVASCTREAA